MPKVSIKNSRGQNLVMRVTEVENPLGLVFIEHGITGSKDQSYLKAVEESFNQHGFTTVSMDATNANGESDGDDMDLSFTNHYNDLVDVVNYAKTQKWYMEPFALSGHSLGGMSILYYAENHPEKISFLVPLSPATSGKNLEATVGPEALLQWQEKGYYEKFSKFQQVNNKVPYAWFLDMKNYDVFDNISKLTMPTFIISGDQDTSVPPAQVKELYEALPAEKELYMLKDCPHSMYEQKDQDSLLAALEQVLKKINVREKNANTASQNPHYATSER